MTIDRVSIDDLVVAAGPFLGLSNETCGQTITMISGHLIPRVEGSLQRAEPGLLCVS